MDESGDGSIDYWEFKSMVDSFQLGLTPVAVRELLRAFDQDNSGSISYREFCEVMFSEVEDFLPDGVSPMRTSITEDPGQPDSAPPGSPRPHSADDSAKGAKRRNTLAFITNQVVGPGSGGTQGQAVDKALEARLVRLEEDVTSIKDKIDGPLMNRLQDISTKIQQRLPTSEGPQKLPEAPL